MRISDWSSDVCSSDLATMVGRLHSAARAVELGFTIEADPGPSGNLRHWRITGIPQAVCDLYSKRADEIDAYLAEAGHTSYRARSVAARDTRRVKHIGRASCRERGGQYG